MLKPKPRAEWKKEKTDKTKVIRCSRCGLPNPYGSAHICDEYDLAMENLKKNPQIDKYFDRGLNKGIETWKVELSGLIYDMVNHRPSHLPHLKGLIPNFKDIEKLIEFELSRREQEVREGVIKQMKVWGESESGPRLELGCRFCGREGCRFCGRDLCTCNTDTNRYRRFKEFITRLEEDQAIEAVVKGGK